ncbi:MAG: hypothetical protein ACOCP4_00865 [Candidatus Woesearchaeota archaeon]
MIIYSRTALAQNVDGELTRLTPTGPEQDSVKTFDHNTQQLLEGIYEQMKILNFQMAIITENDIDEIIE